MAELFLENIIINYKILKYIILDKNKLFILKFQKLLINLIKIKKINNNGLSSSDKQTNGKN